MDLGSTEVNKGSFFSFSKLKENLTELHPKVRPTCYYYINYYLVLVSCNRSAIKRFSLVKSVIAAFVIIFMLIKLVLQ